MTTYMIRTPNILHVIKAYEYMEKRGIDRLDNSNLQNWVKNNCVSRLVEIKAIFIADDSYDGYVTSHGHMFGYDEIIHLEETVTL